ncbi:TPA: lipid IV(A) 3-deoxy-D-manno-octulosonic acid transferase [Shewanella algae]|nr:lipid IV(A) 3-deoxy-D-manno-octulosonic acid transferase [Shewanella algae]
MNLSRYSLLLYLLSPLLLLYLAFRALKSPDYRGRWGERFGLFKAKPTDLLIHTVSMGETLAAVPLIKALMQANPDLSVTVTTTSPTGSREVNKAFGDTVQHCYLPFDLPWCVRRFLNRLKPANLIVMETELWPNLLHQAKKQGVGIMLANARLSAKSAAKYQKWAGLSLPMLQLLDKVAVQTQAEAERFIALGVAGDKLSVCGSLKFDLQLDQHKITKARGERQLWGRASSPVWVAGSVHPGEFAAMLECHKRLLALWPEALLIMVPRHPEQFDNAATAIKQAGLAYVRRSSGHELAAETQVLLGDTMGELLGLYACGDLAFVGGTLITNGGHNPLEPVALGLPVFVGPHHWDFAEITRLLQDAGALQLVEDASSLASGITALLQDSDARRHAAQAGLEVVSSNRGALQKQLQLAQALLSGTR